MKYNERELRLFGTANVGNVDQEGYLWKRGERKSDGYRKRWFVLKGNLLYYFRSHDPGTEPLGCIVLERVSVVNDKKSDVHQRFQFRLEFDSPDARIYFLWASASETRKIWVDKIRQASFEHLRDTLLSLQRRLVELTGRNPLPDSFSQCLAPDVAAPEPSRNLFRVPSIHTSLPPDTFEVADGCADADVEVFFALQLECYGLPMIPHPTKPKKHIFPSTYVTLERKDRKEMRERNGWIMVGRTEIIEETTIPKFKDAIPLSQSEVQSTSRLRLTIHNQLPFSPPTDQSAVSSLVQSFMPLMGDIKPKRAQSGASEVSIAAKSETPSMSVQQKRPEQPGNNADDRDRAGSKLSLDSNGVTLDHHTHTTNSTNNDGHCWSAQSSDSSDEEGDKAFQRRLRNAMNPYGEGTEEEDDEDHSDLESIASSIAEMELSDTNPFKDDVYRALGEPLVGVRTQALGCVEIKVEEIFKICDSVAMVVNVPLLDAAGATVDGALRITCRRRAAKFLKTPRMEDAPVEDDDEEEELPFTARDSVALIEEMSDETRHMVPNVTVGGLNVQEVMRESPYFRTIPMQLLQRYIEEDRELLHALDHVELVGPLRKIKREMYDRVLHRHLLYQEQRAFLDGLTSTFKSSRQKKDAKLEMVPTNLHAQLVRVEAVDNSVFTYETLTMGCPAAHSLGFKQGGFGVIRRERDQAAPPPRSYDEKRYLLKLSELAAGFAEWKDAASSGSLEDGSLQRAIDGLGGMVEEMKSFLRCKDIDKIHRAASQHRQVKPKLESALSEPQDFITALDDVMTQVRQAVSEQKQSKVTEMLRALTVCYESCYYEIQECLYVVQIKHNEYEITFPDLIHRHDVIFSQILTTLVTCFISKLSQQYTDRVFTSQLVHVGFLFHTSSLLSTHGTEEDMLDDAFEAIMSLSSVKFTISMVKGTKIDPLVKGKRHGFTVDIGVSSTMLKALPEALQQGHPISIRPLLFTQGVNEMQTVANSLGNTDIQDTINSTNLNLLEDYVQNYHVFLQQCCPDLHIERGILLNEHLHKLKATMQSKKQKNIEILLESEKLSRMMNGGRATMCKSGKDRSSMQVTLEEVMLLIDHHGLPEEKIHEVLDDLRTRGTRIRNVKKNIDDGRYAFNRLQVMTLPKLLRPPEGTYGATLA
eukprot:m.29311 g.29311  ORF g.29311 m.29311 type:complete len:1153 (+) comp10519_c0_seq1:89-3547(+)